MSDELEVRWGPCCFQDIAGSETDPSRLTVETSAGMWQVWFCHAACFKKQIKPDLGLEPGQSSADYGNLCITPGKVFARSL